MPDATTADYAAQDTIKLESALYLARHRIQVVPAWWIRRNDGLCACPKRAACGKSSGKHPIEEEWQRRATTNATEIRRAWKQHPSANVYAACGIISDLTALDWDEESEDGVRRLEAELGPLPQTPRVNSGTPGHFHLLFKHVTGLINLTKVSGFDVRNDGGGVIAAGSSNGNGPYSWAPGCNLDERPPVRLPQPWVRYFLNGRTAGGERVNAEAVDEVDVEQVKEALAFIDPAPRGIWRDIGMALQDALGNDGKALWDAWSKRCTGKFDQRENDRQWASFEPGKGIGLGTLFKLAEEGGWKRKDKSHGFRETADKPAVKEPPRPLYRTVLPGEPYPVDALGELGAAAARQIHDATQAPIEICAQSVLANMNLAVMAHINIELPHGEVKPVSEFFASIAESGERKSSADNRASYGARDYEEQREDEWLTEKFAYDNELEAWERQRAQVLADSNNKASAAAKAQALNEIGPRPEAPVKPMILAGGDPTVEGLVRLYHEGGTPIAAIFTDEGAQFVGSHAMHPETKARTAATLSHLWDGKALTRIRGGDGYYSVRGRRATMHLLFQPEVAQTLFADPVLCDQGLLTRFLSCMPPPAAGTRPYVEVRDFSTISRFSRRAQSLLERQPPYLEPGRLRSGLNPAILRLSDEARALWIAFVEQVETLIGPGGPLEPVKGLANKAPEHAARLAATVARFEKDCDEGGLTLSAQRLQGGIELVDYYLHENLRIKAAATVEADLTLAKKLLRWLHSGWAEPLVSLPDVYQFGPYGIRDKETAARIVAILVDHGWLEPHDPAKVRGTMRRDVWTVIKEEMA